MIAKHWVIIFRIWQDHPIHHAINTDTWRTGCGRPIGDGRIWLPKKHVEKFARPCKSCFPGGNS